MRASFGRIACLLVLGAALLLPGCKKKKDATQAEGPQGNPIVPRLGEQVQGGGAVQEVRRAAQRTVALSELGNFSLAYFQYRTLNPRPPSGLDDIKDSLTPNLIAAFQEGHCVPVWNVRDGSSDTVVAYVKEPDIHGTRVVATADGKARRMNREEFEAAMKKK
jgi:hypothetical protein